MSDKDYNEKVEATEYYDGANNVEKHGPHVNLNSNIEARIQNPLAGIPRHQLLRNVESFAKDNDMTHILPLLQKGALVAQEPENFENVEGLDEAERIALREEKTHKWRQPWALYMTIITCSIGAAVQYVTFLASYALLILVVNRARRVPSSFFSDS